MPYSFYCPYIPAKRRLLHVFVVFLKQQNNVEVHSGFALKKPIKQLQGLPSKTVIAVAI